MDQIHKRHGLPYCRVSSKKQEEEGSGLKSQLFRLRNHCTSKRYPVAKEFLDTFSGGGDFMERPAMRELLAYIDQHPLSEGEAYVVVFDDLTRFARDVEFHWKLRKEFHARGVEVECLNFEFDESPEGRFVETVLAGANQLDREKNQRQVRDRMRARLEAGYWAFAAPAGYQFKRTAEHGKLLVPDGDKSTLIKEGLEGFAQGRFQTQQQIVEFFHGRGYAMTRSYIKTLVSQILYTGYIEYPAWGIARRNGKHEGIISLETYQAIQDKISEATPTYLRQDYRPDFPLRGFATCTECERGFTASWSTGSARRHPYYRCNNRTCPYYSKSIRQQEMHEEFEEMLVKITPEPLTLKTVHALAYERWRARLGDHEGRLTEFRRRHDAVEVQIAQLIERIPQTQNSRVAQAYETQVEKLTNEQQGLAEKIQRGDTQRPDFGTALGETLDYIKKPHSIWTTGDLSDQGMVLSIFFKGFQLYHPEQGFGTPNLSPGLAVIHQSQNTNSTLVDANPNDWNGNTRIDDKVHSVNEPQWDEFEAWVFESAERIREHLTQKKFRDAA